MSTTTGTFPSPGDEDGHARDRPAAPADEAVSDADLWRRAVAGDSDSFGVIFDRHGNTIHAYCARRTGSLDAADDLVSIVFLEAWRRRSDVELIDDKVLPWLYGIAGRTLQRRWRTTRRHRAALDRLPRLHHEPDHADDVAARLDDQRHLDQLQDAFARLRPAEQEVLTLCVWQGLDYASAAVALGVLIGTVRSRLSRARARLQTGTTAALDFRGEDSTAATPAEKHPGRTGGRRQPAWPEPPPWPDHHPRHLPRCLVRRYLLDDQPHGDGPVMTSTLNGMDRDRHAAVRALLVQQARTTASRTASAAGTAKGGHPQRADEPAVRRPIWRRPKLALTSAGGLLAAGLAIVAVVTVSRPLPAYAVSGGNGKEVKVKINRLEGAHALEEALRKKGIAADITYLPSRQRCQPDRYVDDTPRGMSLGVSADRFEVTIPAGAVGTGETFVLSASVTPLPDEGVAATVDFGVATGPIAVCTPTALPAGL